MIEVIAHLAYALGRTPEALLAAALRPVGRHVLLIVEDRQRSALAHARAAVPRGVDGWVWAASDPENDSPVGHDHRTISLHRGGEQTYEADLVAASLRDELRLLGEDLVGQTLGLVFAETSAVMVSLDDPQAVISFEHRWAEVVTDATAAVGAHAAWNVCVYELAALETLSDPVEATIDLIRSHDTLWTAHGRRVETGRRGVRRILDQLRPAEITPTAWRCTVDLLIDDLALAA